MIPIRDINPSASRPIVTRTLIAINCAVFVYELMLGSSLRGFMYEWGMVPARLTMALGGSDTALGGALGTVFTSMFLHGGWAHLIGNMWYLWIFGDNVEDRLGPARYLLFYLTAGVVSALVHYASNRASMVPTVGASGAIAGVLGAYAVAFPRARVVTLVPLVIFFQLVTLPALLVLGLWFVFQLFTGTLALAGTPGGGGVAWWAHIGGFVFGGVAMAFLNRHRYRRGGRRLA